MIESSKLDKRKKVTLKFGNEKVVVQRVTEEEVKKKGLVELGIGFGFSVEYCAWMGSKYCKDFIKKVKYFQVLSQVKETNPSKDQKIHLADTKVKFYGKRNIGRIIYQLNSIISVKDIMTKKIEFFEDEETSKRFCIERDIDRMPMKIKSKEYILFNKKIGTFTKRLMEEEEIIYPDMNLHEFIDKTRKRDLFFVFEKEKLIGIIHFCDLINSIAYVYFYALFNILETELRKKLKEKGLKNDDLLDFLKERNQEPGKIKNIEENICGVQLPEFQHFEFSHLIKFAEKENLIQSLSNKDISYIIILRNNIMHHKDLSGRQKGEDISNEMLYEKKDYKKFLQAYDQILKLIEWLEDESFKTIKCGLS